MNTHNIDMELIQLINIYVNYVKKIEKDLLVCLKLKRLCDWRHYKKPIKGNLNNIRYAFHGSGCRVLTSKYDIDFEFDLNCNVGSFNIWNIWNFVCNNRIIKKKFKFFMNISILKETCLKLNNKHLIKIDGDGISFGTNCILL